MRPLVLLLGALLIASSACAPPIVNLTVSVPPLRSYEIDFKRAASMPVGTEIECRVTVHSHDISFFVRTPDGRVLARHDRLSGSNTIRFSLPADVTAFTIVLDNSYSLLTPKTVSIHCAQRFL